MKCPNYIICNNDITEKDIIPHDGLCFDCHLLFGKWRNKTGILGVKKEEEECPLCGYKLQTIYRPSCNHFLCLTCFKKLYFGIEPKKPKFPFAEKEVIYWVNIDNENIEEWMNNGKIQEYLMELQQWNKRSNMYLQTNSKCFECF